MHSLFFVIGDAIGLEIIFEKKKIESADFSLGFLLMVHFIELRTLFNRFENEMNKQHFKWAHSIVESKMYVPLNWCGVCFNYRFCDNTVHSNVCTQTVDKKKPQLSTTVIALHI